MTDAEVAADTAGTAGSATLVPVFQQSRAFRWNAASMDAAIAVVSVLTLPTPTAPSPGRVSVPAVVLVLTVARTDVVVRVALVVVERSVLMAPALKAIHAERTSAETMGVVVPAVPAVAVRSASMVYVCS